MSKVGVVIGKFMPLHKGHIHLIEFAKNFVDDLTVLVDNLPDSVDTMNLADRVAIVQKTFPNIKVKGIDVVTYQDPSDSPDFWECWRDYIIRNVGQKPDYIIGSMDYIKPLADVLECEYIMIDKARTHLPISATMIRDAIQEYMKGHHSDFFRIKDFIPEQTNLYLTRDIFVVGGESTGKTTFTHQLSKIIDTVCVNEYAVDYISEKGRDLKENDLINIAKGQRALQKTLRKESNLFCVHDTDLITTKIWCKKMLGAVPAEIESLIQEQPDGVYVLLKPSLKWVHEDYRYYQSLNDREWFHNEFRKELEFYHKTYIEIDFDNNALTLILNQLDGIYEGKIDD